MDSPVRDASTRSRSLAGVSGCDLLHQHNQSHSLSANCCRPPVLGYQPAFNRFDTWDMERHDHGSHRSRHTASNLQRTAAGHHWPLSISPEPNGIGRHLARHRGRYFHQKYLGHPLRDCRRSLWHFTVRDFEEQELLIRFGEPYQNYCNRAGLWLPRLLNWPK